MSDNVQEMPLIGVALVVLTDKDGKQYSFTTATKANAKLDIEEGKKTELIIKGALKAMKKFPSVIKGVSVEFQDNMFLPEVVALLQGGIVEIDSDSGEFKSYTPPVAGVTPDLESFDVDIYTEETDTDGQILSYAKLSLPNGKGEPVDLAFEDEKFFSATYTINTAPSMGQPPYKIERVAELPEISA